MRIRSRIDALERRAGPTGECRCPATRHQLLYCRDPSVPEPPPKRCAGCGLPVRRLLLGKQPPLPGELPDEGPAYQEFASLREFYIGTVRRFAEAAP